MPKGMRMASYQWGATESLTLEEFDLSFRRYRLQPAEAEAQLVRSLQRYGQLSPVVVCELEGRPLLVDGFKRHAAARQVKGMHTLWARRLEADACTAKAALYTLNVARRPLQALEEAWLVYALVREDGLSQPAAAELLGRHKSWVCRRLALLERLAPQAREDLGLGLLSPTAARQLTRLPAGNQLAALDTARRESLTALELTRVVDLLLSAGTQQKREYILAQPRQALREYEGDVPRSWDPRLSPAGNRLARRLASLLDLLGGAAAWLQYRGRGVLELRDREPLQPGLRRLHEETLRVAELTQDFLQELQE
jgi:ParB-like chromosome segregation protein Spo0J